MTRRFLRRPFRTLQKTDFLIVYDFSVFFSVGHRSFHQIHIIHDNVLDVDITPATVIFVYLVPEGLKKMRDALINAIQRGVRIVSYGKITILYFLCYLSNILSVFSIPTLKPGEVVLYKSSTNLYLYDKVEFLD
jgi:hypothetical protein